MRGYYLGPRLSSMDCADVVILSVFFISILYSIPYSPGSMMSEFSLMSMMVSNFPSINPYLTLHISLWKLVLG